MTDTARRIAYVPDIEPNNAYVSRMQEVLRTFGVVEKMMPPRRILQKLLAGKFRRYDVTVFNWVENGALKPETGKIAFANVVRLLLKTVLARLVSRKLVYVRHNTYPHLIQHGQEDVARKMIDRYERLFHMVFSHSGAEPQNRYRYVPHPLYKHAEDETSKRSPEHEDLPRDYFVMFGRVVPYKKILEMARSFPANQNLLIIGFVKDEAYSAAIQSIDRPNVFYRPGYLEEVAAQRLIRGSHGIVLAHAGESTVVSGSFFYAMSLPVPVLALETPFLQWVEPQVGRDLLVLAPSFETLIQRIAQFVPRRPPADAHRRLEQAFGDETIAKALAPVFDRR